jgi:hypothetical protein
VKTDLSTCTWLELIEEIQKRTESGVLCAIPHAQKEDVVDLNHWWGNVHTARGMCIHMSEHIAFKRSGLEGGNVE